MSKGNLESVSIWQCEFAASSERTAVQVSINSPTRRHVGVLLRIACSQL